MYPQLAAFAIGVGLTAAPGVFGYPDPAAANDHVAGPLAAMFGLVAVFEATRPVRWLNLPVGAWLLAAPWVLGYGSGGPIGIDTLAGAGLACLACVRGRVTERFGGGWAELFQSWRPATEGAR